MRFTSTLAPRHARTFLVCVCVPILPPHRRVLRPPGALCGRVCQGHRAVNHQGAVAEGLAQHTRRALQRDKGLFVHVGCGGLSLFADVLRVVATDGHQHVYFVQTFGAMGLRQAPDALGLRLLCTCRALLPPNLLCCVVCCAMLCPLLCHVISPGGPVDAAPVWPKEG